MFVNNHAKSNSNFGTWLRRFDRIFLLEIAKVIFFFTKIKPSKISKFAGFVFSKCNFLLFLISKLAFDDLTGFFFLLKIA